MNAEQNRHLELVAASLAAGLISRDPQATEKEAVALWLSICEEIERQHPAAEVPDSVDLALNRLIRSI